MTKTQKKTNMKQLFAFLVLVLAFFQTKAQNAFLQQPQYRGAFAPSPVSPWTSGWVNWDPQNTVYPAANVIIDAATDTIKTNTTWTSNNVYLLKGVVYVKDGATLTIQPGTIIRGSELVANSSLVVTRGSKLIAEGNASRPIVFTSNKAAGTRQRGNWGGLIILGKATNNITASATGSVSTGTAGLMQIEGLATTAINRHGAGDALAPSADDNDSSGVLKFVRVEFPGYVFNPNNEINGITFGSVGRKTVVDYIQVSYSDDDAYEWFGGTMNISHAVAFATRDDDFDTDFGYNGSQQFGLIVRDPDMADASRSNAFESDNEASGNTRNPAFTPKTNPQVSNFTVIGPWRYGKTSINSNHFAATEYKRNTELDIANSVMIGWQIGFGFQDSISLARFRDSTVRIRHNILAGTNNSSSTSVGRDTLVLTPQNGSKVAYDSSFDANTRRFRYVYRNFYYPLESGATNLQRLTEDTSFFTIMKNERIDTRGGILVDPMASSFTTADYRPIASTSLALSNYDYSTGASDFTISSVNRLCTTTVGDVGDIATSNASATGATYSVTAVTGASTYVWSVPDGFTITGGQGTRSITVTIARGKSGKVSVVPGALCTTGGNYTYGNVSILEVQSCDGVVAPTAPSATINHLNLCHLIGQSGTGRDSVAIINASRPVGAVTWVWGLPTGVRESVGNLTGTVSTVAPTISLEFTNTFVANSTINLRAVNACGDTSAARVIVLKATAPAKGLIKTYNGTIDITPTVNVCSLFSDPSALESSAVQYSIRRDSLLVTDTAYTWTVSNSNMIIVGSANDSLVSVKFGKDFLSGVLTITKESGCGSSSTALTIKKLVPAKPGLIITKRNGSTPTPFLNVCDVVGQTDSVRYELARTPLYATSLNWSLADSTHMEVVHGGGTNTSNNFISVKYRNTFTSTTLGTIQVSSQNSCGISATTSFKVKATPPAFPPLTTINGATSSGSLCGSTNIVLTTSAIATDSTVNDYIWFLPTGITPNASSTATLVGNVVGGAQYSTASNSIAIDWGNVKAAKITVAGRSNCGTGKAIGVTLSAVPAQPGVISECRVAVPTSGTEYDLSISAVTGAGGSTPYIWKVPAGMTIVSGQYTTTLRVRVSGTAPASTAVVTVSADNDCGTSLTRSLAYSVISQAISCAAPGAAINNLTATDDVTSKPSAQIKVMPNPNKGQFTLTLNSSNLVDKANIQIVDGFGRVIYNKNVNNNNGFISTTISDVNFASGSYTVLCTIGSEVSSSRIIVQK
jgi:hypothetical protein